MDASKQQAFEMMQSMLEGSGINIEEMVQEYSKVKAANNPSQNNFVPGSNQQNAYQLQNNANQGYGNANSQMHGNSSLNFNNSKRSFDQMQNQNQSFSSTDMGMNDAKRGRFDGGNMNMAQHQQNQNFGNNYNSNTISIPNNKSNNIDFDWLENSTSSWTDNNANTPTPTNENSAFGQTISAPGNMNNMNFGQQIGAPINTPTNRNAQIGAPIGAPSGKGKNNGFNKGGKKGGGTITVASMNNINLSQFNNQQNNNNQFNTNNIFNNAGSSKNTQYSKGGGKFGKNSKNNSINSNNFNNPTCFTAGGTAKINSRGPDMNSAFYCAYCSIDLYSKWKYDDHCRNKHVQCQECGESLPEFALEAHMLTHQTDDAGVAITESTEEVARWIAARRARFPTKDTVQKKKDGVFDESELPVSRLEEMLREKIDPINKRKNEREELDNDESKAKCLQFEYYGRCFRARRCPFRHIQKEKSTESYNDKSASSSDQNIIVVNETKNSNSDDEEEKEITDAADEFCSPADKAGKSAVSANAFAGGICYVLCRTKKCRNGDACLYSHDTEKVKAERQKLNAIDKQNKEVEQLMAEKKRERPRRDGLFKKLISSDPSEKATFEDKKAVADRLVDFFAKHREYLLAASVDTSAKDDKEGDELIEVLQSEDFDM